MTTPSAISAARELLRVQEDEQDAIWVLRDALSGRLLMYYLDVQSLLVSLHMAIGARAACAYLLARVPAANDPGGLGPRAA